MSKVAPIFSDTCTCRQSLAPLHIPCDLAAPLLVTCAGSVPVLKYGRSVWRAFDRWCGAAAVAQVISAPVHLCPCWGQPAEPGQLENGDCSTKLLQASCCWKGRATSGLFSFLFFSFLGVPDSLPHACCQHIRRLAGPALGVMAMKAPYRGRMVRNLVSCRRIPVHLAA